MNKASESEQMFLFLWNLLKLSFVDDLLRKLLSKIIFDWKGLKCLQIFVSTIRNKFGTKERTKTSWYRSIGFRQIFWNILLESDLKPLLEGLQRSIPAGIYLFNVNNRNTRTRSEICSELKIKTPERRQWRHSVVFIVNFKHILHLLLSLTLNM